MTPEQLWAQFQAKHPETQGTYEAWAFGSVPDELAALVIQGKKTATAGLDYWYAQGEETRPQAGSYSVVLNSAREAVCVIQTTRVYVVPFVQVTEDHAWKEGEGDRSLAYWRRVHEEFFAQELQEIGQTFSWEMDVVCEEFQLVYVPEEE